MAPITEQQLEARFSDRSILSGGERYFDPATGSAYVEACAENDFAIVGIEGFDMADGAPAPRMDLIADFSKLGAGAWEEFKNQTIQSATRFLGSLQDASVYLNFTVLSRSEWEKRG